MQRGQILIEAVLALAVAVVIIAAISGAAITSVNNSSYSRDQNSATDYARQGIEVLKQQSETDWTNFSLNSDGSYCFASNNVLTIGLNCSPNIGSNNYFIRQVQITKNSTSCGGIAGVTEVSVIVSWSDGKCTTSSKTYCHQVILNSCLANIGGAPATP
jgi:type II secretory pathway pseudopilin PulG